MAVVNVDGWFRCTMDGSSIDSKTQKNVRGGPDGNGWLLLSNEEVEAFCGLYSKLYHNRLPVHNGKHLCCKFGTWAFQSPDPSEGHCAVQFLRYNYAGGLAMQQPGQVFGEDVLGIVSNDLLKTFKKNQKMGQYTPHVWQRIQAGEIAVDFCVG
jgi:hypothetical protein